jgi:pimeloyl-ACP methyl ester carboxylesterase
LLEIAAMNATAVIFLHGIGGSAQSFAPQVESFASAGFRPIPLDLLGYGGRPAVETLTFEDLAADVETAMERLRLDRPVLVGHSIGGMVVQTLLRRRPDTYRAAVLSCTSAAFGNPAGEFQKQFVADRLAPLEAGRSMGDVAREAINNMMGPNPDPAGRAAAMQAFASTPAGTYRAAVRCLVNFDERANLTSIRIPVLCLAGEHDRNAPPAMMQRIAAKIPNAHYVCLLGVGHQPNLEAPGLFDAAVLEFLERALQPQSESLHA